MFDESLQHVDNALFPSLYFVLFTIFAASMSVALHACEMKATKSAKTSDSDE